MPLPLRFLPASDSALLVELDGLAAAMALHRALLAQPVPGVQELVPAARTLLVHYRPSAITPAALMQALAARAAAVDPAQSGAAAPGRVVEIPVHYAGEDLPEVAELLGTSVREVIARHTGQPWQAAFAGFAPGFVYLAGGHPSFQVPRRSAPRTRVPAGSVALGGDFSAVYPSASPGGWQLIGVTDVPMWDLRRPEPAYIQPGFQVQFVDAGRAAVHISLPPEQELEPKVPQAQEIQGPAAIEIVATGLQTLVQDAGRAGMAGLGISPSGALDLPAMRQANRLVGNPPDAPVLEQLLGGLRLRCHGRATLAVAGAPMPLTLHAASGGGRPLQDAGSGGWPLHSTEGGSWSLHSTAGGSWSLPQGQAVALDDGDELFLAAPPAGVRAYIAVRGGWQVTPVLGSCATDTLAQVGPPALQPGQRLAVGDLPVQAAQAPDTAAVPLPRPGELVQLDVVLGPRSDWFTPEALQNLQTQEWRVTPQSSRVGMRLDGAQPLVRARGGELPSEGTVTGAIQVPAGGQPVLFLADHPLTGGYPVIAAVARHHLPLAAQIPVGCRVRFNVIAPFFEQVVP